MNLSCIMFNKLWCVNKGLVCEFACDFVKTRSAFLGDYEFVQVSSVGGGPYNVAVGKIGVDESEVKVN